MAQLGSALVWGTRGPEFKSRWPDHFSLFYGFRFSSVSTRFPLRYLIPPVALLAAVAWASSFDESSPQVPDIVNFDKVAHFFVFGLLGTLWFRWVPGPLRSNYRLAWAFLLTISYGIVDEWIQFYNPLRSSDLMDIVADGAGAATAIFVYRSWGLYRCTLETRFGDVMRGRISKEAEAE